MINVIIRMIEEELDWFYGAFYIRLSQDYRKAALHSAWKSGRTIGNLYLFKNIWFSFWFNNIFRVTSLRSRFTRLRQTCSVTVHYSLNLHVTLSHVQIVLHPQRLWEPLCEAQKSRFWSLEISCHLAFGTRDWAKRKIISLQLYLCVSNHQSLM